jgi:hypothetical protein
MTTKKACVIHTPPKRSEAEAAAARLKNDGYSVCVSEVTAAVANAVKAGDKNSLPGEVQDCLAGAEVCVILVDEAIDLGAIAGIASDMGCEIITVGGSPADLPTSLDDITDGHLPSPEAPQFEEVVEGKPDMIKPDNTPSKDRDTDRVKCQ